MSAILDVPMFVKMQKHNGIVREASHNIFFLFYTHGGDELKRETDHEKCCSAFLSIENTAARRNPSSVYMPLR